MRHLARSAAQFVPTQLIIASLQQAASACTGCDLYQRATQTVFGEGSAQTTIMFVGEQPGDQEDQAGHPFVGPAGKPLDKALAEAGIAREKVYITNAVKHFKWEPHGKRRKHKNHPFLKSPPVALGLKRKGKRSNQKSSRVWA